MPIFHYINFTKSTVVPKTKFSSASTPYLKPIYERKLLKKGFHFKLSRSTLKIFKMADLKHATCLTWVIKMTLNLSLPHKKENISKPTASSESCRSANVVKRDRQLPWKKRRYDAFDVRCASCPKSQINLRFPAGCVRTTEWLNSGRKREIFFGKYACNFSKLQLLPRYILKISN